MATIEGDFEKKFFLDYGSERTVQIIREKVKQFNSEHGGTIAKFLENLRVNFPNATLENHSHFFSNDRCARIVVKLNDDLRFVTQLSIYHYFSIYQRSMSFEDGIYSYKAVEFIDPGESEICDRIFDCLQSHVPNQFIWVKKSLLAEKIDKLSIDNVDEKLSLTTRVSDVLFVEQYI